MEKYQADQSFQKQYEKYVKQVTPTHNLALQMLHAFVTGGAICTVGQIILNVAKLNGLDDVQQEACVRFYSFWRAHF